jgi:hypothetical protein
MKVKISIIGFLLLAVFGIYLYTLWKSNTKSNTGPSKPVNSDIFIEMPAAWTLEGDWLKVYIPQNAIPAGSKTAFTIVPEPTYQNLTTVYFTNTFQISASFNNVSLTDTGANMVMYEPISPDNPALSFVKQGTLSFYFWDDATKQWLKIKSVVDFDKGYALGEYNRFGIYSLRGLPVSPAPQVLSVEPSSIKYNQDVLITIKGDNFQKASRVNFGIGTYNAEFIDSRTLRVKLEKGMISPGTFVLLVSNPDEQRGSLDNALTVE